MRCPCCDSIIPTSPVVQHMPKGFVRIDPERLTEIAAFIFALADPWERQIRKGFTQSKMKADPSKAQTLKRLYNYLSAVNQTVKRLGYQVERKIWDKFVHAITHPGESVPFMTEWDEKIANTGGTAA